VFASGGRDLGVRAATLEELMAPAIPPRRGFFDECLRGPVQLSLGFMKPSDGFPFGHAGAFGAPGAGGSMGYADPSVGIGYGYVTNQMGVKLNGDPRDVALRAAIPGAEALA
jgi:CubicO group peptidase (beta-lactamase class C family)